MNLKYSLFLFFFLNFISVFSQNREANDCVNAIQICGNQTIELNPTGRGVQEINWENTCKGTENNSLWLKVKIKESGTLGFDLIPINTDLVVDYDFWIFGPNASCGNTGVSIRCSTTNPLASGGASSHTGLRDSEPDGDFFEGPGDHGDQYIKSLNVLAGETYFLVIDRPIGDGAFKLNWTGTAVMVDPFNESSVKPFKTPEDISLCTTTAQFDFSVFTNEILNGNTDFDVSYYNNVNDAYYLENPMVGVSQIVAQTYYYRIQSKSGECFQVHKINATSTPLILSKPKILACNINNEGVFNLNSVLFTNQATVSKKFYRTEDEAKLALPGTEITNPQAYRSTQGTVYVNIVSSLGCASISEVELSFYPIPVIDKSLFKFEFCDPNLDGIYEVNLSDITKQIVPNSGDFIVNYYLKSDPTKVLPNLFSYSNITNLIVEVKSKDGCYNIKDEIELALKPKIIFPTISPIEVCDPDLDGKIELNFSNYQSLFSSNMVSFYKTGTDAKKSVNEIQNLTITNNDKVFVRIENSTDCPQVGELNFIFKSSKRSTLLKDHIICKDAVIGLDAGAGFDSYQWSNGSKASTSGLVGKGDYYVDLGFNGCIYRQFVKVQEEEVVKINVIHVENDRVTIEASGGSLPYQYSIDGQNWQVSNIFENVGKGLGKVYVRSGKNCGIINREFYNINFINTITPNGDGYNDVFDFSDLRLKNEVNMQVVDRYGHYVFKSKDKSFVWDGKVNGRVVPSATYWVLMDWVEPDTGVKFVFKSWLLVKNR